MSLYFGFHNSLNGDRPYNAVQISQMFDGLIYDGVFATFMDAFIATEDAGMSVNIGAGRAWFDHTWTYNDSILAVDIGLSELVLDRIDLIVLEVDNSPDSRTNVIKVIEGTPSETPVEPSLISSELINQYPLCSVYVAAGATEILQVSITNKVGTGITPFVTGIIDTINTTDLVLQWQAEFDAFMVSIEGILDENTAGNLLNLINVNIADISTNASAIVGKSELTDGSGSISTSGWVANAGIDTLKLVLSVPGVLSTDFIDVAIDKDSRLVASEAGMSSSADSGVGTITFYAETAPTAAIPFDWKAVR